MKIGGKALTTRNTRKVPMVRGGEKLELTVCAVAPGWENKLRQIGLMNDIPRPPVRVRERKPGLVIRKENGELETYEDRLDPGFQAARAKWNARMQALQVAEHLSMDELISFETPKPVGNSLQEWLDYADGLVREMSDPNSGFTDGEMQQIVTLGEKLESSIDLDNALTDFLSK